MNANLAQHGLDKEVNVYIELSRLHAAPWMWKPRLLSGHTIRVSEAMPAISIFVPRSRCAYFAHDIIINLPTAQVVMPAFCLDVFVTAHQKGW